MELQFVAHFPVEARAVPEEAQAVHPFAECGHGAPPYTVRITN
jgi:hypothetical protein